MGELPGLERNNWIQHLEEEARKEVYGYYHGRMMYQRKKLKRFLKKHYSKKNPFIIQIRNGSVNNENISFFNQYERRWRAFNKVFREWSIFLNPDTRVTIKDTGLEVMKIIEEVKHDE